MKKLTIILTILCAIALTSCGKIPKAYRGVFENSENDLNLVLKATSGTLTYPGGEIHIAKARALSFKKLAKGKPGIYVNQNSLYPHMLEVYWVEPKLESDQAEGDYRWFNAEVIYGLFDARIKDKDQVPTIKLTHCAEGTVILDAATDRWQIGCPAGADEFQFKRIFQ